MMFKKGKQAKINEKANRVLNDLYERKGIDYCEVALTGCQRFMFLSRHHRHKRRYYRKCPELLSSFNHTIMVCGYCHEYLEQHPEESRKQFERLRGPEVF